MASQLKWTKAAYPAKTYRARTGSLSFTIDGDGSEWRLRAWVDGKFSAYETGPTLKALKQHAQQIADTLAA